MNRTPLETTLDIVCGKWKGRILWTLLEYGTVRFNELQRLMGGSISARILSRELKSLVENDLIVRVEAETPFEKAGYKISDYGESAVPFLNLMNEWGKKHMTAFKSSDPV